MKNYFEILRKCPLFNSIEDESLAAMLGCLAAKERRYKKGDTIFAEGEAAKYLGIVLAGNVKIVRVDYYGSRSILASIEASQIFGEAFVCAGLQSLPVHVIASEETAVLLLDAQRVTRCCSKACSFHSQIIFNLLTVMAKKNLVFHQKIEITSKRTTREKLMTYLLLQAKDAESSTFTIPYDRQELADYLGVERSGLSAEISKLRKEHVLACRRSTFTLLVDKVK